MEPSPILHKSSPCEIISFGSNIDLVSNIQEGFLIILATLDQLIFLYWSHSVRITTASEFTMALLIESSKTHWPSKLKKSNFSELLLSESKDSIPKSLCICYLLTLG